MKTNSYVFCIAIFVTSLNASSATAKVVNVFLLGGQSNAVGAAATSGLPDNLKAPQADVDFYYGNGSVVPLAPTSAFFGPEIAFGRYMADYYAAKVPNTSVAIIKYAVGATSINDNWQSGDPVYNAFNSTVTTGLTALNAKYPDDTVRIAGMIWMQGESDVEPNRPDLGYDPNDLYARDGYTCGFQ